MNRIDWNLVLRQKIDLPGEVWDFGLDVEGNLCAALRCEKSDAANPLLFMSRKEDLFVIDGEGTDKAKEFLKGSLLPLKIICRLG